MAFRKDDLQSFLEFSRRILLLKEAREDSLLCASTTAPLVSKFPFRSRFNFARKFLLFVAFGEIFCTKDHL